MNDDKAIKLAESVGRWAREWSIRLGSVLLFFILGHLIGAGIVFDCVIVSKKDIVWTKEAIPSIKKEIVTKKIINITVSNTAGAEYIYMTHDEKIDAIKIEADVAYCDAAGEVIKVVSVELSNNKKAKGDFLKGIISYYDFRNPVYWGLKDNDKNN